MIQEIIVIAIVAYVYAEILTSQGMLLGKLYNKLHRLNEGGKLPDQLFKPLIGCVYCVAGQMSLWLYLVLHWCEYNLLLHVSYTSLTIFAIHIIVTINDKLNHD